MPAQLAILGRGEKRVEEALQAAAARYPGTVSATVDFDEGLAHAVEAGADLFLMPSRFEPCGLNQMYSQRYGTPPVARATGGLADTIVDGVTGFLFQRPERAALVEAVRRALAAWRDAARWRKIQRAGMARDFSWAEPARRYADLYLRLAQDFLEMADAQRTLRQHVQQAQPRGIAEAFIDLNQLHAETIYL